MENLIAKGKKIINSQQNSVLSAATLIMIMIAFSMILGLVRQRVLASYFTPDSLSLFFAAFRLPDAIFQMNFFFGFYPCFYKNAERRGLKSMAFSRKSCFDRTCHFPFCSCGGRNFCDKDLFSYSSRLWTGGKRRNSVSCQNPFCSPRIFCS
ncbi:MAG: hypothetical protein UT88_C0023G0020 [Candidatus Woesebacteria bacterium GW2011_GWD2_40_19]|nr:MAG: hypothetical protein UT88_C0023G0020 [Candidatus Woesebacteria bacterium GW2011_GWD2_40_19]